jgi:GTP-binding protein YchF
MNLGIIGLTASGKTTIFNALTGENLETGTLSATGRLEVHTAAVDVPDARLEALAPLFNPRKITHMKVTYADIGGMSVGAGREGLSGPLVNELEKLDGLLLVVRAFENPQIPHPSEMVDARRDAEALATEFLLHDMVTVDRRRKRLQEERGKGGQDRALIDREIDLFERLAGVLNDETPLRRAGLREEELQMLAGYGLLSTIPQLVVVNLGEDQPLSMLDGEGLKDPSLGFQGKLEMEIAQLAPEEQESFLKEYGLDQPGRERAIQASFQMLNLISFFTGNEEEVRAWTLPQGGTCLQAADTIHSDLARGFIRAEVIHWDTLVDLGGMSEARAVGQVRVEGKQGKVIDGDLVYIRFNL